MITVTLYTMTSEPNRIGKTLSSGLQCLGSLRDASSIIDPVILLEAEDVSGYNYAYIPAFGRYYFLTDMVSQRTGLWEVSMHSDPLESFKDALMSVPVILSGSEDTGKDRYLPGPQWTAKVKELTDILPFPRGLDTDGEYILITAGG